MQGQMQVPTLTKANKFIIGAYIGMFILSSILASSGKGSLISVLGLSSGGIQSGMIFQYLTFPFVDAGFTAVLFNALLIWFIGSELEVKWGTSFYLKYILASVVGAGLFYTIAFGFLASPTLPIYGMTGTNLALILAYALVYSERTMVFMFIFPMKAKYFCMILGAIELFMGFFSSYSHAAWTHLAAMAGAFIYLKVKSLQARGVTLSAIKAERHRKKMKGKLSLVKNEEVKPEKPDPDNPKYWQ